MAKEIYEILLEMRQQPEPFAVATVVETIGSVSAKTGAKAVINHKGRIVYGWVGGGCAQSTVCYTALECIKSEQTTVIDIDMNDEVLGVGMPCGGAMRVYVEPVLSKPTIWLMGNGRIAECICLLGDLLGYHVIVNDTLADDEHYPNACSLINDDSGYSQLNPLPSDYVVIATQHKGDHESMKRALNSEVRYIALIASRKRSRLVMQYLREEGFDEAILQRVRAPAGINLAAKTPEEIALSVLTEIVMLRRGGDGRFMRDAL